MATTYNTDIQKLYVAYFNRPADPAGLAYWETVVEASNGDTTNVSASFAASSEYTAAYGSMTNAQIISAVYQNLFGRTAETAGVTYWANLLDAKTITMADAVTAIAAGAQGTDSVAYADKVTAASAFTAALDTTAEVAGYQGAANAAAKTWLSTITDSNSLTAALDPATLNTTVANIVAAGTPFSVAGALSALDDANTALDTYVKSIDVDGDSTTVTTAADITAAYYAVDPVTGVASGALQDVADLLSTNAALFVAPTTTDAVRDALVSAQVAINSAALTSAQAELTSANTDVSKVAGLSAAMTTLTAAKTALTAAQTASTAADADLAAKEASFTVTNAAKGVFSVELDASGNPDALILTSGATVTVLATVNAAGKATIADGITASKYAGLTDVITSYNADLTAHSTVVKAQANTDSAQLNVNHLDVDSVTIGASGETEAQLLVDVTNGINAYATANPTLLTGVASGSLATEAQITTAQAVMTAHSAAGLGDFNTLVDTYHTAAVSNPLATEMTTATADVKAANTTITDLTTAVAALHTAEGNVSTLAGYEATITADEALLKAQGYTLVDLTAAAGTPVTAIGTVNSDIFVVHSQDASINLFGLQGTDSLFVGSGYTMVTGAIGATGVTGSNTAMEIFVSTNADGDAQLQIETHAYSSSVATTAGEVITITLQGVDASTLHLDNGIITSSTAATAA